MSSSWSPWGPRNTAEGSNGVSQSSSSVSGTERGQPIGNEMIGSDGRRYSFYRDGDQYGLYANGGIVNGCFFSGSELRDREIGAYYRRIGSGTPLVGPGIPNETPRALVDNLLRQFATQNRGGY